VVLGERVQNSVLYNIGVEIGNGTFDQLNVTQLFQGEMAPKFKDALTLLAMEALPLFLNSKLSLGLVRRLRHRELGDEAPKEACLRTVAFGMDNKSESFWLEMFQVMSETVSIGMVVSDMTVPGIPLVYINEGFKAVTGYGKEKVGCNCRFLQGPETQRHLNEEIVSALRQGESLLIKLYNYKANGQKFQCLLALYPVFGPAPENEYKYQIGLQVDFNNGDPLLDLRVTEMARVIRQLPQTVGGEPISGLAAVVGELEAMVEDCQLGEESIYSIPPSTF